MNIDARVPISSHPAFAPAVGLWFAALLGLGLFVMPDGVHAQLAMRTGVSEILPGRGDWRVAISAIAALLGFLFGLGIARRVTRSNTEIEADARDAASPEDSVWLGEKPAATPPAGESAAPPLRLFNPREELDEAGIGFRPPPEDAGESALIEAWREERVEFDEFEMTPAPRPAPSAKSEAADESEEPKSSDDANCFDEDLESELADGAISPIDCRSSDKPIMVSGTEALGDLSLPALTRRLGRAIEISRQREAAKETGRQVEAEPGSQAEDPVIAFLRREADRTGAGLDENRNQADDPQAVLRGALDKLSRVSNPK